MSELIQARKTVALYEAEWTADNGSPESSAMLAWALVSLIAVLQDEEEGISCSRRGGCAPRVISSEVKQLSERVLQLTDVALAVHSDNAQTWRNRYRALYSLERFEEGIEACKRALALEPDDLHSKWGCAACLYYLQRFAACAKAYEQVFEADPASSEALEWASRAYALAGDPKNAQRIGEAGLARFPDKAEFARIVFHGRMKDGHFEEALQVARKSASDNPEDHAPRVAEGHALLKLDRRDEAIDAFEDAIRRAPDCGAGYAGMLEALGPGAAPDRIRGVFRDALASGDFSGVDFAEVSRWATHNGYETEALAILDKISESNPDAVSVYAGERGAVLEKLGKSAEAEEQHALAAEAMQKHLDIILAQFSAQTENADLAQLECERNMRAKILEHLISVFEAGKKPLQAQRCLEALQKLSPNRSATSRAEMASETPVVQP